MRRLLAAVLLLAASRTSSPAADAAPNALVASALAPAHDGDDATAAARAAAARRLRLQVFRLNAMVANSRLEEAQALMARGGASLRAAVRAVARIVDDDSGGGSGGGGGTADAEDAPLARPRRRRQRRPASGRELSWCGLSAVLGDQSGHLQLAPPSRALGLCLAGTSARLHESGGRRATAPLVTKYLLAPKLSRAGGCLRFLGDPHVEGALLLLPMRPVATANLLQAAAAAAAVCVCACVCVSVRGCVGA